MRFNTPRRDRVFEIPDEWWQFAEMDRFSLNRRRFYTCDGELYASAECIALDEIEPPQRSEGVDLLRKCKLVPVLMAFQSPGGMLPPVEVKRGSLAPGYRFKLWNGAHRYFASVAAGFPFLPAIIRE